MKSDDNRIILVPVDFSDCAFNAARTALDIVNKCGGSLHFFHNCNTPYSESHLNEIMDPCEGLPDPYAQVGQRFDDFIARLDGGDNPFVKHMASGDLAENLNELQQKHSFDMIVMGSHGATGWKELLFGSNAQKVVQRVGCPVLTVKHYGSKEFKNIIFLTNLNKEARDALDRVAEFARCFNSTIHIVHIKKPLLFHEPQAVLDYAMQELTRGLDVPHELYDFPDFSIESGLEHLSEHIQPEIIAIGTYGRGKLSRIFRHSVTQALVNHFDLPIMSVNFETDN